MDAVNPDPVPISLKPFIYQVALNLGYSQISKIADVARSYKFKEGNKFKVWQPKNYEKNFEGLITLKDALVHSRNLATINLVEEIGLEKVYKELEKFSFTNLPKNLSLALGSVTLSPLSLAKYYTIFPTYGKLIEPYLVSKITKNGRVILCATIQSKELVEPKQAFLMIDMLRGVVEEGTGRRAKVKDVEVAGKTGTTNRYVDAWFCGFTPDIEAVVWFGQDDNTPLHKESGGKAAAPVVGSFIKRVYELHPELKRKFRIPKGVYSLKINGKRYYFTDISKPPKAEEPKESVEELLF